jgi:hypothetical protein
MTPVGTGNDNPILVESKFVGTLHGVDNNNNQITVSIRAGGGPAEVIPMAVTLDGSQGLIHAGASGTAGQLDITDAKGVSNIKLTGNDASAMFGASGQAGQLQVTDAKGVSNIRLAGSGASAWFGASGQAGDILIFASNAKSYTVAADAAIWIKGETGDIILQNADCAEEFEVQDSEGIEPGVVLALSGQGKLTLASRAYDRKVAGVVSGAGGLRPGIVLGRSADARNRWPIALSGKVFCRVDADQSPIAVGDLLTTSSTPGHAMAARDHRRAFGAVIGKALQPLPRGRRLIPILVALQ